MDMAKLVAAAGMMRRAAIRIGLAHRDHMLVHMVAMRTVQVAVVKIVDMVAVANGGVPAIGAVLVGMAGFSFRIAKQAPRWPFGRLLVH